MATEISKTIMRRKKKTAIKDEKRRVSFQETPVIIQGKNFIKIIQTQTKKHETLITYYTKYINTRNGVQ